jgi:hypothetical protein
MEQLSPPGECFAAFVVNAWSSAAHISVDYAGASLGATSFIFIPSGLGGSVVYGAYDSTAGLPPGQAAILFLAGDPSSSTPCPKTAAVPNASATVTGTGIGASFHITTDVPVAAYEINPYPGGFSQLPGASLLLPTSVWGTNYLAATASDFASTTSAPSLNLVAMQDGTQIKMRPILAVEGGGAIPATPANTPFTITLNKGQQAQISQQADLTGSIVQSTAPVGLMAGHACMQVPSGASYCDHGEQMLPPVQALGSAYASVMFRPRVTGDQAFWRLVGAANGTQLSYSPSVAGAPLSLSLGQVVEFSTAQPFIVQSQDANHPFYLFTQMSGGAWTQLSDTSGYGDPDFVLGVSPAQFSTSYAFTTDPTFPESDLVFVRAKDGNGAFDDVRLECVGPLTGWQPLGAYEWTRLDLVSHDFAPQTSCTSGGHTASSAGPFGMWVWGWGSPETTTLSTKFASYGYPAGMGVAPINPIVLTP